MAPHNEQMHTPTYTDDERGTKHEHETEDFPATSTINIPSTRGEDHGISQQKHSNVLWQAGIIYLATEVTILIINRPR